MLLRLLQSLLTGIALLAAMRPREARVPAPEPQRPAAPGGINYRQIRYLIVAGVFLVFGLWLALWFASQTRQVLTLLTISILLAMALRPTVDRMSGRRMPLLNRTVPRALAIFLIYLVVALIAAGVGFAVVPPLITEFQNLITNLPSYAKAINDALQGLKDFPFLSSLGGLPSQVITQIVGSISQAFNVVVFAINLVTGILSIGVVPLGKAEVKRQGTAATIVTYSYMVLEALAAAEQLAARGIDVEVVDLRSVNPIDWERVLSSVKKTGKLIAVYEACKTGGLGAEICSRAAEELFDYLDAPVQRVAGLDTPIPYNRKLERAAIPNADQIVAAVDRVL